MRQLQEGKIKRVDHTFHTPANTRSLPSQGRSTAHPGGYILGICFLYNHIIHQRSKFWQGIGGVISLMGFFGRAKHFFSNRSLFLLPFALHTSLLYNMSTTSTKAGSDTIACCIFQRALILEMRAYFTMLVGSPPKRARSLQD